MQIDGRYVVTTIYSKRGDIRALSLIDLNKWSNYSKLMRFFSKLIGKGKIEIEADKRHIPNKDNIKEGDVIDFSMAITK